MASVSIVGLPLNWPGITLYSGFWDRPRKPGAFLSSLWAGGRGTVTGGVAFCGLPVAGGIADFIASASIGCRPLYWLGITLCSNICFRSSGPGVILTAGANGRGVAVGAKTERSRSLTIGLAPSAALPGNDRILAGGRFILGIFLMIGILVIRPGSILGRPILIRSRKKGFSRCPTS